MTTPWTIDAPHALNDNFKIQPDKFLQDPHGILVEEIMAEIDTRRVAVGMPKWVWYLYDIYEPPSDPALIMTANDFSWNGAGWEVELITNPAPPPPKTGDDTQRKSFVPSTSKPSQLIGYDSFISNYIQDIAKALHDTDPTGDPIGATQGLLRAWGMENGTGHSAQTQASISALKTDTTPEYDSNLNALRPKVCLACLVNDAIEIYNIFPYTDGQLDGARNKLNRFYLRDENGVRLTGMKTMFVEETTSAPEMFILFNDNTVRRFDSKGKALVWESSNYIRTLAGTTSHIYVSGTNIWYVTGGILRENTSSGDTAPDVNYFNTIGREVLQITGISSRSLVDLIITWFGLTNIGDGLPDVGPPSIVQETGFDRVVTPGIINAPTSRPLLLKGGKLWRTDTAGSSQFTPYLNLGDFYIDQKYTPSGAFDAIVKMNVPRSLYYYSNITGKTPWNTGSQSNNWLQISSGIGEWKTYHEIDLFPGPVTDTVKSISRSRHITWDIPTYVVCVDAPYDEPWQYNFSGSSNGVIKGTYFNHGAIKRGWIDREIAIVYHINMEAILDEPYTNKEIVMTMSFNRLNIAFNTVVPPIPEPICDPNATSGLTYEQLQVRLTELFSRPFTVQVHEYTGTWPPAEESDLNAKGALVAEANMPTNPYRMIQSIDQPGLYQTFTIPVSAIGADGFLDLIISTPEREEWTTAGHNCLGCEYYYSFGTQTSIKRMIVNMS